MVYTCTVDSIDVGIYHTFHSVPESYQEDSA